MDHPDPHQALAREAMNSLRRIVRALRLSSVDAQRGGISGAQRFVLEQLEERPAESIAELARRTLTDPSSVSVVVSRLEQQGLIVKRASKTDARRFEIALSRSGRGKVAHRPRSAQEGLVAAMESLDKKRLAAFTETLRGLVEAIGAQEGAPAMFFEEEER